MVKFGVKKVKRLTIWDGGSTLKREEIVSADSDRQMFKRNRGSQVDYKPFAAIKIPVEF